MPCRFKLRTRKPRKMVRWEKDCRMLFVTDLFEVENTRLRIISTDAQAWRTFRNGERCATTIEMCPSEKPTLSLRVIFKESQIEPPVGILHNESSIKTWKFFLKLVERAPERYLCWRHK